MSVLWQVVEGDILGSIHRHHVKGDVGSTFSGLVDGVLRLVVEGDIPDSIHRPLHRRHIKGDVGGTLSGLVDGAHSSLVQGSVLSMAPLSRTGLGRYLGRPLVHSVFLAVIPVSAYGLGPVLNYTGPTENRSVLDCRCWCNASSLPPRSGYRS